MYNNLAKYYDELLRDNEATKMWLQFFNRHKTVGNTLELACGTGEITLAIANDNKIVATDLSQQMIDELKVKDKQHLIVDTFTLDMTDFELEQKFDNIVCFCDSINYLIADNALETMFKSVYKHLNAGGVFMFDMHTKDRLVEFEDPFIETGELLGTDYQWSIISEDEYIYHHFAFYEDEMIEERHIQRVFEYEQVASMLKAIGFEIKVFTDFTTEGLAEGEKIFIVGVKK